MEPLHQTSLSQIAYGGWQKICHAILPRCNHLTTLGKSTLPFSFHTLAYFREAKSIKKNKARHAVESHPNLIKHNEILVYKKHKLLLIGASANL